jgi:hypothetical protein
MNEYVFDPFVGHKMARIFKLIAIRTKAPTYDIKCEEVILDYKGQKINYVSGLRMTMSNDFGEMSYVLSWHHYMGSDPEHKFRLSKHPESKGMFHGTIQWEYMIGMVYDAKDIAGLTNKIVW